MVLWAHKFQNSVFLTVSGAYLQEKSIWVVNSLSLREGAAVLPSFVYTSPSPIHTWLAHSGPSYVKVELTPDKVVGAGYNMAPGCSN